MSRPIRIALVNDYQLVVAGLAALLRPFAARVEVVELDANKTPIEPVDVAIYDTFASVENGGLGRIVAGDRARRVAVYSFSEDPRAVAAALRAGANGYLSKGISPARLVRAIERIAAGEQIIEVASVGPQESAEQSVTTVGAAGTWPGKEYGLTAREAEILSLIAQGLSNDEIAAHCYLSINTVKSYIRAAYRKASVSTRAQAVGWALRHGFEPDRVRVH